MSNDSIRFIAPWLRKCRNCNNLTVIVYDDDNKSKCGFCGKIHKIIWLPTIPLTKEKS